MAKKQKYGLSWLGILLVAIIIYAMVFPVAPVYNWVKGLFITIPPTAECGIPGAEGDRGLKTKEVGGILYICGEKDYEWHSFR